MHIKLTDAVVQKHINTPGILRDSILTGYGVRIYTSGKASYSIEPTVLGATERNVIGKYPLLSVEDARKQVMERYGNYRLQLLQLATPLLLFLP